MNKAEKEAIAFQEWKEHIQGNRRTIDAWRTRPESFIRWSLSRISEARTKLAMLTNAAPPVPYNLIYAERKKGRFRLNWDKREDAKE